MLTLKPAQRMTGRDIHESHRVSTPLELLFDLVFVVAVAAVASEFHHALLAHHIGSGLFNYAFGLFAIFWAWLNFAWFASAYDTDDTAYRLLTMLQMFGALVLAVGVSKLTSEYHSFLVSVVGYVIMRLALATQWIRASFQDPARQKTCRTYAMGILLVQAYWVATIWFPKSWSVAPLLLGFFLETLVPVISERFGDTPWHAHHIAERYSLFTLIVLGECILGTTNAVAAAIMRPEYWVAIGVFGLGALALIFAIWWLYFEPNWGESLHHLRNKVSFIFGYGHFFIFASIAGLGAAFEVATDQVGQFLAQHSNAMQASVISEQETAKQAVEATHHALTNGYVAMCLGTAVAVFLSAYTFIRWILIDKYHQNRSKLPLAYVLAMLWLSAVVAMYHFTNFDAMWLGWSLMIAPVMMTLVCSKDVDIKNLF